MSFPYDDRDSNQPHRVDGRAKPPLAECLNLIKLLCRVDACANQEVVEHTCLFPTRYSFSNLRSPRCVRDHKIPSLRLLAYRVGAKRRSNLLFIALPKDLRSELLRGLTRSLLITDASRRTFETARLFHARDLVVWVWHAKPVLSLTI